MLMSHYKEFYQIGKELFIAGLNNFHSGNLSKREGDDIIITATGSKLGELRREDIITCNINTEKCMKASCEYIVHKAIYKNCDVSAVAHAHAQYSVVLSFDRTVFKPVDGEGQFYFPKGIPVLEVMQSVGSEEVAERLPGLLKDTQACIVRGHGIFATGKTLEEAAKWISSIENSAKLVYLLENRKV
jgi:L-fuculose-phosphate aldolase